MFKLRLVHYLMLAPVQGLLLAFIFLPSLYVLWLSFNESTYGADTTWVGLQNYAYILGDRIFWRAAWNTFIVVNAVVYGELVLGLGLAVLMSGWVPFKRVIVTILLLPYAVTEVTAVVMWRYMLEPDVGMINYWLVRAGLDQIAWSSDRWDALIVVSLLTIWLSLPFTFLILYSAVNAVPREPVEAAMVDGAGRFQVFLHVTLPSVMPAVLVALLFRYVFAMRLFSEVWLLTEGGPARLTEVLAVYLYRHGFRYREFGIAAATGWLMLVLSLLIASYYLYQMHKRMFRNE